MRKSILSLALMSVAVLCCGIALYGQNLPETTVEWTSEVSKSADGSTELVFRGRTLAPLDEVHGTIEWISCIGDACHSPEETDFRLELGSAAASEGTDPSETAATLGTLRGSDPSPATGGVERSETVSEGAVPPEAGNIWALILEAILWGFAMLLTPCVFPMVPMTVSFFIKGGAYQDSRRRGGDGGHIQLACDPLAAEPDLLCGFHALRGFLLRSFRNRAAVQTR